MRRGASAAQLKRLDTLARPPVKDRSKGVMLLPRILSLDAWEARAAPYQAALMASMDLDLHERSKR
jgi:hypothetical protein